MFNLIISGRRGQLREGCQWKIGSSKLDLTFDSHDFSRWLVMNDIYDWSGQSMEGIVFSSSETITLWARDIFGFIWRQEILSFFLKIGLLHCTVQETISIVFSYCMIHHVLCSNILNMNDIATKIVNLIRAGESAEHIDLLLHIHVSWLKTYLNEATTMKYLEMKNGSVISWIKWWFEYQQLRTG